MDLSSFSFTFTTIAFVKVVVIILIALYSVFAFVVFVQVRVMNRVIHHSFFASLINLVSLLFLISGGFLFALSFIVL